MKVNIALDHESTKGGWFTDPESWHVFNLEVRLSDEEISRLRKIIELNGSFVWFEYNRDIASEMGFFSGDSREKETAKRVLANWLAEGRKFGVSILDLLAAHRDNGTFEKKFLYDTASERDNAADRCKQNLASVKDTIDQFVDRTGQTEAFEL